eukprot:COSAG02_NODE_6743_length_3389_cov_1.334347_3_plen_83_part_00
MRSLDHTNRCPMCRTVLHTRLAPFAQILMHLCFCVGSSLSRAPCVRTDLSRTCLQRTEAPDFGQLAEHFVEALPGRNRSAAE